MTLLIWISCFFSLTELFAISESSSQKDKCFALISFLSICILIIIKLSLCGIKKKRIKKDMLDSAIPFLHYLFLICYSNIKYGYGNTEGIIGHREVIGLFSIVNISYNIAFILLTIIYAILFLNMILKYNMSNKTIPLSNNRITSFAIIIGVVVELIGIYKFVFTNELCMLYIFSIAFFWLFNLIICFISIINDRDK